MMFIHFKKKNTRKKVKCQYLDILTNNLYANERRSWAFNEDKTKEKNILQQKQPENKATDPTLIDVNNLERS